MIVRLLLALILLGGWAAAPAQAFETSARAAIIIDYRTGAVLFEKDADVRLPPASMSKLMTAYMVFDQLRSGRIKLEDKITVSERAWKMGGSQMFLKVGDRVAVEDLIQGIIVQSGNDACVAMAEAIAGSEAEFAREATAKARDIGLTNSTFANATGLDAPDHLMSVRDLGLLTRHIIADFPDYFRFYSEREFTYAGITQPNRNPLLQAGVPGVDGMKTGFTDQSGYGLVATAKRDDRRLIVVLAGLTSAGQRKVEGERVLEYGFREFQEYRLFQPGQKVAEADVWLGAAPKVALVTQDEAALTLTREARKGLVVKVSYASPIPAPVTAGTPVGHLEIEAPGAAPLSLPLVAADDVPKATLLGRATGTLSYLLWGATAS